jgi:glycerophosphoryl diester phosphodiesterase
MVTRNIGHRGARSLAPENTLAAFRKAWDIGADGIEVDVQVSADGQLVIHHDKTPARTTNVSECFPDRANQPITTFLLDELRELDAGSWFIDSDPFSQITAGTVSFAEMEQMSDLQIPTLEETLLFVNDKHWQINLELKKMSAPLNTFPLVEEVIKCIDSLNIDSGRVVISSFHHPYLDMAQHLRPEIEVNALIGGGLSGRNNWGKFVYEIYNANQGYIDHRQVIRALEHGCTVNLYTVNDADMMQTYIDWGVSSLITDYPQTLKNILKK